MEKRCLEVFHVSQAVEGAHGSIIGRYGGNTQLKRMGLISVKMRRVKAGAEATYCRR
jgi:hypothetical protein